MKLEDLNNLSKEEAGLLLHLLLMDIRGNWAFELRPRIYACRHLAKSLSLKNTQDLLAEFEWDDGRHFRCDFDQTGGYEGMEVIHNLPYLFHPRSDLFKELAKELITHPNYQFNDWKAE